MDLKNQVPHQREEMEHGKHSTQSEIADFPKKLFFVILSRPRTLLDVTAWDLALLFH